MAKIRIIDNQVLEIEAETSWDFESLKEASRLGLGRLIQDDYLVALEVPLPTHKPRPAV